jgi:hypothetical protein
MTTFTVPGRTRRMAASATHGDASSFWRHDSMFTVSMFVPRMPSSSATTSPFDSLELPLTVMRVMVSASAFSTARVAR